MTRNTILAAAFATGSAAALSGCLGTDDPLGPIVPCTLTLTTQQHVAGDTLSGQQGLLYIEREPGSAATAQSTNTVDICYVARFTSGQILPGGAGPLSVKIGEGRVVPGFEQGLVGIGVGGVRRLIVPPALAYGSQDVRDPQTGQVVIPANSTLVFDIQLLRIQ